MLFEYSDSSAFLTRDSRDGLLLLPSIQNRWRNLCVRPQCEWESHERVSDAYAYIIKFRRKTRIWSRCSGILLKNLLLFFSHHHFSVFFFSKSRSKIRAAKYMYLICDTFPKWEWDLYRSIPNQSIVRSKAALNVIYLLWCRIQKNNSEMSFNHVRNVIGGLLNGSNLWLRLDVNTW